VTRPLRRPGVVRVDCDAHGWMESWLVVVDNPCYAQTGADGSFNIADVPPGSSALVVWQEHAGAVEMPVTVKAKETLDMASIELPTRTIGLAWRRNFPRESTIRTVAAWIGSQLPPEVERVSEVGDAATPEPAVVVRSRRTEALSAQSL